MSAVSWPDSSLIGDNLAGLFLRVLFKFGENWAKLGSSCRISDFRRPLALSDLAGKLGHLWGSSMPVQAKVFAYQIDGLSYIVTLYEQDGSFFSDITVVEGANHATASGRSNEEPGVLKWLFSWERE